MDIHLRQTITAIILAILFNSIMYFSNYLVFELWTLSCLMALGTSWSYRKYLTISKGVTKETFLINMCGIYFVEIIIILLGVNYFWQNGYDLKQILIMHLLLLGLFVVDGVINLPWRKKGHEASRARLKPYGPSEIIEMARKSMIFGTVLLVLLLSLIFLVIIPGFRNLKLLG